ncbi:ABC transporter ATP-binding protein [Cellulomonas sp. NPDC055163]
MTTQTPPSAAAKAPILEVRDLGVEFFVEDEWFPAAVGVSYEVRSGEVLAIVGESGSGKTQSSMSLIGLLPPNGRATGSAKLAGRELVGLKHSQLSKVRGNDVSVIFQEPMTALNPVYTVGFQIMETIRVHFDVGPKAARERAVELLTLVDLPNPVASLDKYPHQLSGGQRQRAMIAQALACSPKLLIADEPTTALDVTVQAEILKLMRDLRTRIDSGIVLITHDMGVVADLADRVLVMKNGRVVESGPVEEIFHRPQHPYTRQLLDAVPHLGAATPGGADVVGTSGTSAVPRTAPDLTKDAVPALEARDLVLEYPSRGRVPAFRAIDGVDLTIGRGEVVGLVGESGSGKTTVGRAAVGLLPVADGSLKVNGLELKGVDPKALRAARQDVSIVFQDPGSSLNPRLPIGESIGEPLKLHKVASGAALNAKVEELLDQVHLPRAMRNRYPHELSGGQRQRVGIARALALSPKLLIADEPTSALDVSVQARVLDLFQELQREYGFACLFISHDLAVVEILSSRIAVMHKGRLVEVGPRDQILRAPQQDYTRRLLAAVPVPDPAEQRIRREARDRLLEQELVAAGVRVPGADRSGVERTEDAFAAEQVARNAGRGGVDGGV